MFADVAPEPLPQVRPVSQLTARAYDWLWPCRLALGKLAVLEGDPEEGKSFVALDLCARLSTGRPMPDGTPGPAAANTLILQDEDGAADTVLVRLRALAADLDRVQIWDPTGDADEPLRLPSQADLLERAVVQSAARLVILDPVFAFLDPGVVAGNEASVRRALRPLRLLAERRHCAILMIRHLAKATRGRALYRGMGSIALAAVCRTAWQVGRDPHDPQRRVLAQVKNNLVDPQPSLAYTLRHVAGAGPVLEWLGPCAWSADQLSAVVAAPELERACDFLAALLKDGPRPYDEIRAAARDRRISEPTLRRARKSIHAEYRRRWRDGALLTYWLLPGQAIPLGPTAGGPPDPLDSYLAAMEKKFPPPSPEEDEE